MSTDTANTATPKTFGPYSPIRQAGNMYFTAGHVGVDPVTKEAPADAQAQAAKALDNLADTLATAGLSLNDVVQTTIFVTDMGDFAAINTVYMERFGEPRPARSTVAVAELPRVSVDNPLKVEIDAVAMKKTSKTAGCACDCTCSGRDGEC